MARPIKNNVDYFPHDCGMRNHKKVKAIRSKYGVVGFGIWVMVLEHLAGSDGNVFPYSDMEFELLSGDFGISATEIRDVVDYCIRMEMLFNENGFIKSESLDERLAPVYEKKNQAKELSKQQQRVNGKFCNKNTDVAVVSATETPQRKVKESKVDDRKEENKHSIEEGSSTPIVANVGVKSFDVRKDEFKTMITAIGGMTYTKQMLDNFIGYWSEPNGAKNPKMKWEVQRDKSKNGGFEPKRRLSTWATQNLDKIECYLTEAQKSIAVKKHEFAVSLEPHLEKYGKETLNSFYQYWSQPENKPEPMKLRYQEQEFWDLGQRLVQWASKNAQDQSKPQMVQRHA